MAPHRFCLQHINQTTDDIHVWLLILVKVTIIADQIIKPGQVVLVQKLWLCHRGNTKLRVFTFSRLVQQPALPAHIVILNHYSLICVIEPGWA